MSPEHTSYNQIDEQLNSGHKKRTVLVSRTGNKISTGHYTGEKLPNGRFVVEVTASNGEKAIKMLIPKD